MKQKKMQPAKKVKFKINTMQVPKKSSGPQPIADKPSTSKPICDAEESNVGAGPSSRQLLKRPAGSAVALAQHAQGGRTALEKRLASSVATRKRRMRSIGKEKQQSKEEEEEEEEDGKSQVGALASASAPSKGRALVAGGKPPSPKRAPKLATALMPRPRSALTLAAAKSRKRAAPSTGPEARRAADSLKRLERYGEASSL